MGKGSTTDSFADTISRASQLPEDMGGASLTLPETLFTQFPIPENEQIVSNVPSPNARGGLSSVPKYNFTAHFKRFVMGYVTTGDGESLNIVEQDDTVEYENLLNEMLNGAALLRWEDRNTLKDGTQVIAVCYLRPKKQKDKDKE